MVYLARNETDDDHVAAHWGDHVVDLGARGHLGRNEPDDDVAAGCPEACVRAVTCRNQMPSDPW
jgi:hypothetical protein